MSLTLEALEVLDAIDRKGSFAAAAIELNRVPSALTYVVRKLEEDIDVLLFDRKGHRAKLTPAGRELLNEGRHILRATEELTCRVKRLAKGWEVELRIAMDGLMRFDALLPVLADFYEQQPGTKLRFQTEVLGGSWDALVTGRADLVIGMSWDTPNQSGFQIRDLGRIEFVFAVAPTHPLAALPDPLLPQQIVQHRAVAIGDTSRSLPVRSAGLLSGQDALTVPDLPAKLAAQVKGLGVGYLARSVAEPFLATGQLIAKATTENKLDSQHYYAWRSDARGKALQWFIKRLEEPRLQKALLR
ncbi:LysR family transcriptional regulator [Ampullimonas aquatilis]|uniref:LysR family transcriptional regulator n=1 Tax=Ampullimonas aquatilis TaxID=1341549 RepID=UPI003C73E0BD